VVINQKKPAFILSIFGLVDVFGTSNCNYFDNNLNNLQIHKFSFIPLIKKKQFIEILDYIKYFKIRKIKKEILVRLYGKFASSY
jgi:plasmid replication initiation protein